MAEWTEAGQVGGMWSLPGHPPLDKAALIGECARLCLHVDAAALLAELNALPEGTWRGAAGRNGIHQQADALFLRGHAPAEGPLPIIDREVLSLMPRMQALLSNGLPGQAQRCLIASMPAGARVPLHIDQAPYFEQTIRLHIPLESHERAYMVAGESSYVMRVGEVWALNNCALHGVWNADAQRARIHLISDRTPDEALLAVLRGAERGLGRRIAKDVAALA